MVPSASDSAFAGAIPQVYDELLVPLIFETHAADLARRAALRGSQRVLEIAAGTGAVTRALARAPYAYFEREATERDVRAGEFDRGCTTETLAARSRAASPRIPAIAFCQGTPLRGEIDARGAPGLAAATDAATEAIAREFGAGAVDGAIQALVVVAER